MGVVRDVLLGNEYGANENGTGESHDNGHERHTTGYQVQKRETTGGRGGRESLLDLKRELNEKQGGDEDQEIPSKSRKMLKKVQIQT